MLYKCNSLELRKNQIPKLHYVIYIVSMKIVSLTMPDGKPSKELDINKLDEASYSLWYLCLGSIGPLGASFTFSLQYAYLTTFTIAMGMPEVLSSMVWLCGPVTGIDSGILQE